MHPPYHDIYHWGNSEPSNDSISDQANHSNTDSHDPKDSDRLFNGD